MAIISCDYWTECVSEAMEDAGIKATKEQSDTVAGWVEGAHDNYGLATGLDVVMQNYESPESIELKELKKEIAKREQWQLSTYPCKTCTTTGIVRDGWGRDAICPDCNSEGRVRWKQ